jgi:hypothetical protein
MAVSGSAGAAALGYGDWLGEFGGNVNDAGDVEAVIPGLDLDGLAGRWEGTSTGQMTFTMTVFKDGNPTEPIGGQWAYLGFPPGTPPEGDPIDLYLAVKYDGVFSVFRYDGVNPLDTGLFSSDLPGLVHNRNGKPFAISHIEAYWDGTVAPIPVPPALLLLGTGVVALFGLRRRKQIAG